ncbi:uncharacterized protein LOC135337978 [Halichondria panicea]|uniref:uncharacterized protein LOC135337978 n=1 Tax=Halichondria panicea TaxID=6063 RepID=UPI00312B3DBA
MPKAIDWKLATMFVNGHLRQHIFMVVALIIYSSGSQGCSELYTIVPSNFTGTCPHEPCISLNVLLSELNGTFNQSISLHFLHGEHLLEEIIGIQRLPGIEMSVSNNCSQCSPIILCNGPASGIIFQNIHSVEIVGLTFSGCSHQGTPAYGGALSFYNVTNILVANSNFIDNYIIGQTTSGGGAIFILQSLKVNLENCSFINNSAQCQPGGLADYCSSYTFNGGAMYLLKCMNVSISDCQFLQNRAIAGAALLVTSSLIQISGTVFAHNGAQPTYGGTAAFFESTVHIHQTLFTNNIAYTGGAIFATKTQLSLLECQFKQNSAYNLGGASFIQHGFLIISRSLFVRNIALTGSIVYASNCSITSTNSSYLNNNATANGGIYVKEGSAIFSSGSYYTGNRAKIGAVYFISNGFTYSSNNTFTNNSAISDNEFAFGGIIFCNCNSEFSKTPCFLSLNNNNVMNNYVNERSGGVILSGDCALTDIQNYYYKNNGRVIFQSSGSLIVNGSHFESNKSPLGVIALNKPTKSTIVTKTLFHANSGVSGSAIHIQSSFPVYISDTTFFNNQVSKSGTVFSTSAGLVNTQGNKLRIISIVNCYFVQNNAHNEGGAIYIYGHFISNEQQQLQLSNSYFYNNIGGAVNGFGITLMAFNCSFKNNIAPFGLLGGAILINGDASVYSSEFVMNDRGAIFITGGKMMISGSTFRENVGDKGAAVSIFNNGSLYVTNCLFVGNKAVKYGGAIAGVRTDLISIESSVYENNTALRGGAVGTVNGKLECRDTYFTNNTSLELGGAVYVYGGSLYSRHTQYVGNFATHTGGAIAAVSGEVYSDGDCYLSNHANQYAGAIYITTCFWQDDFNEGEFETVVITPILLLSVAQCNVNTQLINTEAGGSKLHLIENITLFNNSCELTGGAILTIKTDVFFEGREAITVSLNSAGYGGGLALLWSNLNISCNVQVTQNAAHISGGGILTYNGVVELSFSEQRSGIFALNTATLTGGGIHAINSGINLVSGYFELTKNIATYGGALYMSSNSKIYLIKQKQKSISRDDLKLVLRENSAQKGGGVFINDSDIGQQCVSQLSSEECFLQTLLLNSTSAPLKDKNLLNIFFVNNTASMSGDAIFGGLLDRCSLSPSNELLLDFSDYFSSHNGADYVQTIATFSDQFNYSNLTFPYSPYREQIEVNHNKNINDLISSKPLQICFCLQQQHNCSYFKHAPIYTKKGQFFEVSIVAVDQLENPVNATVISSVINNAKLANVDQTRQALSSKCSSIEYAIYPQDEFNSAKIELFADGPCNDIGISKRVLTVIFQPCTCPIGFYPQETRTLCSCVCDPLLESYITGCSLVKETVFRKPYVWIDFVNRSIVSGYLLHDSCPFDYCVDELVSVNLNTVHGADSQCAFNRTGTLCGACKENLSAVLGSSQCRECTNNFISLLIPFAMAGIALVAFIVVLNMTIAIGTINGLVFYANIVFANRPLLLPPKTSKFLTIFISWLNLDLGIETCFYDGMDSYAKTLLQVVFPSYVILLTAAIIALAKCSVRFSNFIGRKRDLAGTLCTLILLSYSKFIRTIITNLQYTYITYPDDTWDIVWLHDANIPYFKPSHFPRLIAAFVIIIVVLIYTSLILFGQWLPKFDEKQALKRMKQFVNKHFESFAPQHSYWVGLLLLVRALLHIVATCFSDQISLLFVFCIVLILILLKLLTTHIYQSKKLEMLESSFLVNLGVLSVVQYHVLTNARMAAAVADLSVAVAAITFILILGYHIYTFILKETTWLVKTTR